MSYVPTLTLAELLPELNLPASLSTFVPLDITLDSRNISAGSIFCALRGTHVNREDFIEDAFDAGACAVLKCSGNHASRWYWFNEAAKQLVLELSQFKAQLGVIASRFFDHPSSKLFLVGITGTNGKTSCADLMVQAWRVIGKKAASIGTLGWSVERNVYESTGMTTLDVIENHRLLAKLHLFDVQCVAMEVSSHGIHQGRIESVAFDQKVLTNITRDHLDYHGDMDSYAEVKMSFIRNGNVPTVMNADDDVIQCALDLLNVPKILYSLTSRSADVSAKDIKYKTDGLSAQVSTPWGSVLLNINLIGAFNLSNVLAVIALLGNQGESVKAIEMLLEKLAPVCGRLERVQSRHNIFIDFAHTPDALMQSLRALRLHFHSEIIVVFGCGGDRDQGKRSLMGKVANDMADVIVLTSDNPRSEEPQHILAQIKVGLDTDKSVYVEEHRASAIALAVNLSSKKNVVLIAGKGHENYQEIKGVKYPYSDYDEVNRLLA